MNIPRAQAKDELKKLIRGAAHIADTHFGEGAGAAMLGVKESPDEWQDANLDVSRFPIYLVLMSLHQYAFEAVGDGNEIDYLHELCDFVDGICQSPFMDTNPKCCQLIRDIATARWKLDSGEDELTLRELALLGRLDERSVRNAASKNEFQTKKFGNQVFIEPDDARAWLIESRNFQETGKRKPPGSNPVPFETIEITDGNLRNHHLYLKDVMHFFPDDVIGGRNKAQRASRELTMHCGLENGIETDIDGDKKIFRRRDWLGDFFNRHHFVAGDRVVLERLEDYTYHLYPSRG